MFYLHGIFHVKKNKKNTNADVLQSYMINWLLHDSKLLDFTQALITEQNTCFTSF